MIPCHECGRSIYGEDLNKYIFIGPGPPQLGSGPFLNFHLDCFVSIAGRSLADEIPRLEKIVEFHTDYDAGFSIIDYIVDFFWFLSDEFVWFFIEMPKSFWKTLRPKNRKRKL